jgi:hypothetical protein
MAKAKGNNENSFQFSVFSFQLPIETVRLKTEN